MQATYRLEDDIIRWLNLRLIFTQLIMFLFFMCAPVLAVNYFPQTFLSTEWTFRLVASTVPILIPLFFTFQKSIPESVFSLIAVKKIIFSIIDLSQNSEEEDLYKLLIVPKNPKKEDDSTQLSIGRLMKDSLKETSVSQDLQLEAEYRPLVSEPDAPQGSSVGILFLYSLHPKNRNHSSLYQAFDLDEKCELRIKDWPPDPEEAESEAI